MPVIAMTREMGSKGKDIAIIGFPRSGNSFARATFLYANPNLKIASHHHYIAELKIAIKYQIPSLLLIREPIESLSSLVVRNPEIAIEEALERYLRFFRAIPYSEKTPF